MDHAVKYLSTFNELDTVLLQKTSLERNATNRQMKMVEFQPFFENVVHFKTFNK